MRSLTAGVLLVALACTTTEPLTAVALQFNEVPSQAVVNVEFSATIAVVTNSGAVVSNARPLVTLTVFRSPTETPISATKAAADGLAHFDMTLALAGNYTLHATSPGLAEAIVFVNVSAP
jgi:hypothetical protein